MEVFVQKVEGVVMELEGDTEQIIHVVKSDGPVISADLRAAAKLIKIVSPAAGIVFEQIADEMDIVVDVLNSS